MAKQKGRKGLRKEIKEEGVGAKADAKGIGRVRRHGLIIRILIFDLRVITVQRDLPLPSRPRLARPSGVFSLVYGFCIEFLAIMVYFSSEHIFTTNQ